MADFNQAYKITMANEGGYCNVPQDHGGETWRGIARNYWPNWPGWQIVDKIKSGHPASLNAALAADGPLESLVLSFYKANYWDCLSLDSLTCQQIANQLFDAAVNMGTVTAAKFLQNAINTFAGNSIVIDGKVGIRTIEAANALDAQSLYNKINDLRKERYGQIIAADPSQDKFKNSWLSRIKPFGDDAQNLT
jgi:lysozyme family protein